MMDVEHGRVNPSGQGNSLAGAPGRAAGLPGGRHGRRGGRRAVGRPGCAAAAGGALLPRPGDGNRRAAAGEGEHPPRSVLYCRGALSRRLTALSPAHSSPFPVLFPPFRRPLSALSPSSFRPFPACFPYSFCPCSCPLSCPSLLHLTVAPCTACGCPLRSVRLNCGRRRCLNEGSSPRVRCATCSKISPRR